MKYDDASWHSGGEFPPTSPEEFGGTHIALMLRWCFQKGWAGELHTEDSKEDLESLLRGELSATEYLFTWCDGKFTDEDLTADGNAFMRHYYVRGTYHEDYERRFGDKMYVAGEDQHDFAEFSEMVEARYRAFASSPAASEPAQSEDRGRPAPGKRRWWQFW
jgi:hypothetical protein